MFCYIQKMHLHNLRGFRDAADFFYPKNIQLSGFIYDLFLTMCHFSRKELRCHLSKNMLYIIPAKWAVFELENFFEGIRVNIFLRDLKCMDYRKKTCTRAFHKI